MKFQNVIVALGLVVAACSGAARPAIYGRIDGGTGGDARSTGGDAGTADSGGSNGPDGSGGRGGSGGMQPENAARDAGEETKTPSDAHTGVGVKADGGGLSSWLVSEDFESGDLDPSKWTAPRTELSTMVVDSAVAAHGRHSLRIDVQATTANGGRNRQAWISLKNVPAALQGHVFLRLYVRFVQAPVFKDVIFLGGKGGAEYGSSTTFGTFPATAARAQFFGQIENSVGVSGPDIGAGKWICVEVEWQTSPPKMVVSSDGRIAVSRLGPNPADFSKITLGLGTGHAPGFDFQMYIDDLAMDTRRIGCF